MTIENPVFTITDNGVSAPSYAEVLDYFKAKAREIFGEDINLDPDTQDGQLIAIFASAVSDVNAAGVEAYNAYNPQTARGIALDGAVKTNGISRRVATHSTVEVRLVGQVGTVINEGKVRDSLGTIWNLPSTVVIPSSGEITVTAKAENEGAISAAPNSITQIVTPTLGWQTVNNPNAATLGEAVETDAELRYRQTISTMQPTVALWDGLIGSLLQVDGVLSASGRHNDTNTTSPDGIPPHSIALVVDGGSVEDVATTIYLQKSQGVSTYGSIEYEYMDSIGNILPINFSRPTPVTISVVVTVKAGATWISNIEDEIKARIVSYVDGLGIGEDVNIGRMIGAFVRTNETSYDLQGITLNGSTASVSIAWNAVAVCSASNITIEIE